MTGAWGHAELVIHMQVWAGHKEEGGGLKAKRINKDTHIPSARQGRDNSKGRGLFLLKIASSGPRVDGGRR